MGQRIRTAIVAIPIALFLIKMGGLFFAAGVLLLGLVGWREFARMLQAAGFKVYALTGCLGTALLILAAGLGIKALLLPLVTLFSLLVMLEGLYFYEEGHWPEKVGLTCMSLVYLGLPFAHFILLREITGPVHTIPVWGAMSLGEALLWVVMFATWASDTFAYFGGRLWGKTKLAPKSVPRRPGKGPCAALSAAWLRCCSWAACGWGMGCCPCWYWASASGFSLLWETWWNPS